MCSVIMLPYCAVKMRRVAGGCVGSVAAAAEFFVWAAESLSRCRPLHRPLPPAAACCISSARWRQWVTLKCWSGRSPKLSRIKCYEEVTGCWCSVEGSSCSWRRNNNLFQVGTAAKVLLWQVADEALTLWWLPEQPVWSTAVPGAIWKQQKYLDTPK